MARDEPPDQGPDPDGGFDLRDQFKVLIRSNKALQEVIDQQVILTQQQVSMQRQAMAGGEHGEMAGHLAAMQYQPQMRPEHLKQLAMTGGMPSDVTLGMAKVSGAQALTSLQGAQAWAAQQLGQAIANWRGTGEQLYAEHEPGFHGKEKKPAREPGAGVHATVTPPDKTEAAEPEQPPGEEREMLRARPRPGGTLGPMGEQIARGGAGPVWTLPPGEQGAPGGETAAVIAAATEAATKGAVEGAEEVRTGGLAGEAEEAAQRVGERITPERPHVPLPAEEVVRPKPGELPAGEVPPPAAEVPVTTPAPPTPDTRPPVTSPATAPAPPSGPPAPPRGPGEGGDGEGGGDGTPPTSGPPGDGAGDSGGGGGKYTRSQQIWQNVGARVAASGGTGAGIKGLLEKIPILGLGLDIAEKARDVYTEQREKGRVYQEIEGGQNLGAQTERLHSLAYEATMFGRVPEGVAAQMFGDVTAMGYTQRAVGQGQQLQNRQSALDFMYHQYTATGTDVEQSGQILETASQNASVSLKSVSDAMTGLSDVAGKAGVNAKGARDNFNALLDTAIKGGAGPGSGQLAGIVATTQAGYGKAFAKTSFAGQLGPGMEYMMAGQYGIAPSQAQYIKRTQPGEYARMLSGSSMQFIQYLPGMDAAKMADLKSMIEQAGGGAQVKAQPDLATDIGNRFLNKYQPTEPAMDMNIWAQYLSSVTSIPLNEGNVMAWVVDQVAGNTYAANKDVGAAGGSKAGGKGGAGAPVAAGKTGGAAAGQFGLAKPLGGTGILGDIAHAAKNAIPFGLGQFIPGGSRHGAKTWQQVLTGGQEGAAAKTYLGAEQKSGKRSPVLEALLQNLPKDAQVSVQTASGNRVMSVEDAMKYYPDEMASGNAQFFTKGGENLGGTGTITQGLIDPTAQQASEAEAKAKGAGTKAGKPIGQAHVGTARGADAKRGVTVDLTNEAKQLLKLLPGNSDNAAAAATVPEPPYVTSPSR